MDIMKQIVSLEDERNYLRNLIEYANEEDKDVETVIYDKLAYLQGKLDRLQDGEA